MLSLGLTTANQDRLLKRINRVETEPETRGQQPAAGHPRRPDWFLGEFADVGYEGLLVSLQTSASSTGPRVVRTRWRFILRRTSARSWSSGMLRRSWAGSPHLQLLGGEQAAGDQALADVAAERSADHSDAIDRGLGPLPHPSADERPVVAVVPAGVVEVEPDRRSPTPGA
jgi:hypothetical protein